jgi:hypothetical protein
MDSLLLRTMANSTQKPKLIVFDLGAYSEFLRRITFVFKICTQDLDCNCLNKALRN